MKKIIFCDESGEVSFSVASHYKHFLLCALSVDVSQEKKIKNTLKRKYSKLIKLGWPKAIEIKASCLHNLRRNKKIPQAVKDSINGDQFIIDVCESLKNSIAPRIDYIAVRKEGIESESLKNAAYGIAYNYFAGKLLVPIILEFNDCELVMDQRNKETHTKTHFDGYLKTKVLEADVEAGTSASFNIEHGVSANRYGLQAIDYFCWGIYRSLEFNDDRFVKIFNGLLKNKIEWYIQKERSVAV